MKQLKLKFAGPEEARTFVEWANATPNNLFDPEILKYPTLRTLCAYGDDGPVAFLPAQGALVLESLAVKPGLGPIESASAFRDLVKGMTVVASDAKARELYFICNDENVIALGEKHGFEKLPWPVLRMKL